MGFDPAPEYALTARLEGEVKAFGEWLEGAPDEWIMEMFSEPAPPKERPERWIN